MRKIIFLIISLFFIPTSFAQFKLEVGEFSEDTGDIQARSREVKDVNGESTALLKIQIPMLQDAIVESPLKVKDGDYKPGEMLVYLGAGSKRVTIKHQDFEPLEYRFEKPLKGKSVYKLVLKIPKDYLSNGQVSARLSTNVNKAEINIDNQSYVTENGVFLLKLKSGSYPFTINPRLSGFQPLQGTLEVTDEDIKNIGRVDRFYELQSDKKANLHIIAHQDSKISIDGNVVKDWSKKAITLPLGKHTIKVEIGGFNKVYSKYLVEGENSLNADIRPVFILQSPRNSEVSITPIESDALKPAQSKVKVGQPVRLLGSYKLEAKCKGYDNKIVYLTINTSDKDTIVQTIPMVSNASKIYNGYGNIRADQKKGLKEYMKLINAGDDVAAWELGKILSESKYDSDRSKGEEYIRMAATAGNPDANLYMAKKVSDSSLKRKYLVSAIKAGKEIAHIYLADSYLNDNPKDLKKAYDEYSLFKNESSLSKIGIAKIAIEDTKNINVEENISEMLMQIEKDDPMYAESLVLRGVLHQKGLGVVHDVRESAKFWKEAGINNLNDNQLLIMAALNATTGTDASYKYLREVDLSKYNSDIPEIAVGISLKNLLSSTGQNLSRHKDCYPDSHLFLNKAYELGDKSINTLRLLGRYNMNGIGTAKNLDKAKMFFNMVVSQYKKDTSSLRWLGNIYEQEKDIETAKNFYKQAIELGDNDSKGYYGTILYNSGDRQNGIKFMTEAAEKGNKQSMRNLINHYEKIAKDTSKTACWKKKLASLSK